MNPTDPPRPPKRCERTHEENTERAYIAASRRTDRSAEARYKSARDASDLHFKRTGKHFHLTMEIVMNGEMYEEQDRGGPARRLTGVGGHLTYDPVQQKHEEVNREFAEAYPYLAHLAPSWGSQMQPMNNTLMRPRLSLANPPPSSSHSSYMTSYTAPHPYAAPHLYAAPHPTHSPLHGPAYRHRSQSLGQIEQQFNATTTHDMSLMAPGGLPPTRHASTDSNMTPALTPGSTSTGTPFSTITPPEYTAEPPFYRPGGPSTVPANTGGFGADLDNFGLDQFCAEGGLYDQAIFSSGFTLDRGQADDEVVGGRDIPIPSSEAPVSTEVSIVAMPDTSGLLDADGHLIAPTALYGDHIGTPDGGGDVSWDQWVQKDELDDSLDRDGA
ncbi:hypothetical protein QBC34DRAFT_384713 [Podospora aff. communis PSN243]|uniref:Uncharacterized protein n=1 Tax=Podospora aff. communis PSN243 TaxID=3040156 RepID=A0AAV9G845_9PEZI|nr:hypothetical protein QBC34DRAFT_384713 [Podospora aff. communis PSN243]